MLTQLENEVNPQNLNPNRVDITVGSLRALLRNPLHKPYQLMQAFNEVELSYQIEVILPLIEARKSPALIREATIAAFVEVGNLASLCASRAKDARDPETEQNFQSIREQYQRGIRGLMENHSNQSIQLQLQSLVPEYTTEAIVVRPAATVSTLSNI